MKTTFLGTCANQTINREAVSLLIQNADDTLLIDAGPGVVRQLYRVDQRPSELSAILITHSHGDHTSGFAYLLWSRFYDSLIGFKGADTVRVYALPELIPFLEGMVAAMYPGAKWPFTVVYEPVTPGATFTIGSLRCTPVLVDHTVPTIGVRIDGPTGSSIAYSSDTLESSSFIELAHEVDLLIHEGFVDSTQEELSRKTKHATAADAGRVATKIKAARLALVHTFPPLVGSESLLVDDAARFFDGPITVPDELSHIKLDHDSDS